MRVGHLQPTRPEWYDRNPSVSLLSASVAITGADPSTVRAGLTIPTGRKGYIDLVQSTVFRTVAGTPDAFVLALVRYNNLLSNRSIQMIYSNVSSYGPVGDQWLGQGGIVVAGDAMDIFTLVTFTDGVVEVYCTVKLTLFDA